MIKTMGSIKALWISVCLTLVAFLHITGEVYADDYKPDIVGTLTKAGDSVKIENSNSYNIKYVKYVSSTDDLMYIYTDAEKNNVVVRVYDKNGRFIGEYDDLYSKDGQYIDPSNKKNPSNSEIFVKLKKGEVYYLATYINGSGDIVDYNINLIKATKKADIKVCAFEGKEEEYKEYDLGESELSIKGLSYNSENYTLTLNSVNLTYGLKIDSDNDNILSDGLVKINIKGNNKISMSNQNYAIYTHIPVVLTGDGILKIESQFDNLIYKSAINSYGINKNIGIIRVDGPTIDIKGEFSEDIIAGDHFIMDGGKVHISGDSGEGVIDVYHLMINGGEIDIFDTDCFYDNIYSSYFEMNGGSLRMKINYDHGSYRSGIYAGDTFIMNDGVIYIKYADFNTYTGGFNYHGIESSHLIYIKGGNIYVIMSDKVKEMVGEDIIIGIYEGETYEPDRDKSIISDKANILIGKTIDISKVKCSLEYIQCEYDGKEKKPIVYVDGLCENTDYTIAYSDNVKVGTATVTIKGKGDFTGSSKLNFTIEEKKADGPKEGKTIKDKKYIYKVTKAGSKDGVIIGELKVTGLKKKSLKQIKIAALVKIGGVSYKVTSVKAKAFKGNKKITKVTIGKNIKTIGANSFSKCSKLKQVIINSKVLKSIGKNAFAGNKKLSKVIIKSKKLKKIGNKAFYRKNGKKLVIRVPKSKKKLYKKLLKKAKTNRYAVK